MEEKKKVDIIFQPIKKIVIFNYTEFPKEEFFKRMELIASVGQPIASNWAEGIVFLFSPYQPESDVIIQEALKGTMYLDSVIFTLMPKYQPILKIGAREIPIVDQTTVPHLSQIAKWLKKQTGNI